MSGYETLIKINKALWRVFIIGIALFLIEYIFKIHWILGTVGLFILAVGSLFAILFLIEFIWSFFHKKE